MDATRSVADGHRPMERDQPYGRGLLFPVAAAPVVALARNQVEAYHALNGSTRSSSRWRRFPRSSSRAASPRAGRCVVAAPHDCGAVVGVLRDGPHRGRGLRHGDTRAPCAAAGDRTSDGAASALCTRRCRARRARASAAGRARRRPPGRARIALVAVAQRDPAASVQRVTTALADGGRGRFRRCGRRRRLRFGTRIASRLPRRLHDLRRRRRRALELVHARQPRAVRRDRPARRRAGGTCRPVAARPLRLGTGCVLSRPLPDGQRRHDPARRRLLERDLRRRALARSLPLLRHTALARALRSLARARRAGVVALARRGLWTDGSAARDDPAEPAAPRHEPPVRRGRDGGVGAGSRGRSKPTGCAAAAARRRSAGRARRNHCGASRARRRFDRFCSCRSPSSSS